MPLVLTLRTGQDFFVDDDRYVVGQVYEGGTFDLSADATGRKHLISDERATEIAADVFVFAGDRHQYGVAAVVIEAPREIEIVRGERYRGDGP